MYCEILEEARFDEAMRSGKISLLVAGFCVRRPFLQRPASDIATPSDWQSFNCGKPLLHMRVMPAPSQPPSQGLPGSNAPGRQASTLYQTWFPWMGRHEPRRTAALARRRTIGPSGWRNQPPNTRAVAAERAPKGCSARPPRSSTADNFCYLDLVHARVPITAGHVCVPVPLSLEAT